jgi:2-polyprenyl-3-methyl-5-hydroxy-6-metoxy-1,4-benzoquinol methylase
MLGEYADQVKDLSAADWEELARHAAYFRVLTHEGDLATDEDCNASSAFFETGEADISALLSAIASLLGHELPLTSTLDFGCGVGRLTVPLARRSTAIVACDIAPTMLAHARRNALEASLHNVTFIGLRELSELRAPQFDFVCSLLVIQYIPPSVGYSIIRMLLSALVPNGVAALHILFARASARRHRLATIVSAMRRLPRATVALAPPIEAGPRIYKYDRRKIHDEIEKAGARALGQFAANHGRDVGAVLVIQKQS